MSAALKLQEEVPIAKGESKSSQARRCGQVSRLPHRDSPVRIRSVAGDGEAAAADAGRSRRAGARGLHELGFSADDIAARLGVSARHARRLIGKDPGVAVANAAHRWAPVEARRIARALRAQLQAEGIRFHQWVMRGKRRIGPAGLSPEQVWAINIFGLGSDELNELLLRGAR